jgi:hypothetical protein
MNPINKDPLIALRTICGYETKMMELARKPLKIEPKKATRTPVKAYTPIELETKNRRYIRRKAVSKASLHNHL